MMATCDRSNRNLLGKYLDMFAEFRGLEQRKIRCHKEGGYFSVSLCVYQCEVLYLICQCLTPYSPAVRQGCFVTCNI